MSHITIEVGEFKVTIPFETLTQLASEQTPRPPLNILYQPVEDLELSVRATNCLWNANVKYVGELVQKTEIELRQFSNLGRISCNEIKTVLNQKGLCLGMVIPEWSTFKVPASTAAVDTRPVQYYNGGYNPDNIKPHQPRHRMESVA